MSYDLFFKPRSGIINPDRFVQYFESRPGFKVNIPQAWYQNDDTGVYFVFELRSDTGEDDAGAYPVSLNINYFRPSYFVLEAEPEVTKFVQEFDLMVSDPQWHGMGEGEYNADLLVSGWNHGNDFGYSAVLGDPNNRKDIYSLPSQTLAEVWRWNHGRQKLQQFIGESKYLPRVMFVLLDGDVVTAAVWPDGIPIVVPPVDYLIVPRKELAPKRFFRRVEDRTLVTWKSVLPVFERHSKKRYGTAIALDYEKPPSDVIQFVESLPKDDRELTGLSADQVLDRELFEKYAV